MDNRVLLPNTFILQAIRLIKIRWLVGISSIVLVTLLWYFNFEGPLYCAIIITLLVLLLLNLLYYIKIRKIALNCETNCGNGCEKPAKINISTQVVSDFFLLTTILHFSGGIENPSIVFYIFHLILCGIYLQPKNAYKVSVFAITLFLAMVLLEYTGIIPHYSINKYIYLLIENEPAYLFGSLTLFVLTSFVAVFIAISLSEQLRNVQKLLEKSNISLKEKDKIKDEFVQRVSHDLKGGLAVIQSSLSIVNKRILAPIDPANEEFVNKAYNRTLSLVRFVEELLTLTKMRLDSRFETIPEDVNKIITQVINNFALEAEKKNTRIIFENQNEAININCIRVSMEEVFSNLIQNAIKYSPENSTIIIQSSKSGTSVLVKISDNGYGIPEEDLPNLFTEFFRAKSTAHIEGTGLGLSLVKAIIERHNGKISVESILNQGTTFSITLPSV